MPPLIAAGLVSVGVSGTVATILSDVIFTSALVGLSLLFAPDVPKPEHTKNPLRQPVPPRIGIMGRARSAGAYMLFTAGGGHGISVDVMAMCDGESLEFVRLYLHDDVVELVGSRVQSLPDGRYGHGIDLFFRLGATPGVAFEDAISLFPDLWTTDHRGDGITKVELRCQDAGSDDQQKFYPFGLPIFSAVINSRRVFDPRDSAQDWADPSSWSFAGNDNPILQAVTYAVTPIYKGGLGLDFEESFLPVLDEIAAQADICDEPVALKGGGTSKRYTGGGSWFYNDPPGDVLAAMLGACDGFMCERGDGAFTVRAGKFDAADCDTIFTDKHIVSLKVRRYKPDEDDVSGVIVKYNSPPHEYSTVDAPVWPRDAYQGGANDRRIRPVEVVWCQNGVQAQRLSKRVAIYEMAEVTGTMLVTMIGVTVLDRRFARIQCSDDPALADAVIKIDSVRYDLVGGLHEIQFRVIDPDVLDAWDEASEEGPLQPVVSEPIGAGPLAPTSVIAVAEQIAGAVRVVLAFDDPADASPSQNYEVIYRIADIGGGTPGGWSPVLRFAGDSILDTGDVIFLTINSVAPAELEFQVRSQRNGKLSAYSSPPALVDTTMPAPGRPTAFTANLTGADAHLAWTAPNSANMDHARVYRAITGTAFALANDISGAISGAALAAMSFTDLAPPSGSQDYWVVAQNTAGVSSTFAGPRTIAVP